MLQIHNTLTKNKQPFVPIDPKDVRMYICGMTVYDYCHLGHARVMVVFDVVYRYLRELYGHKHVRYIRNITDIDDKIIYRAQDNNESIDTLTERFIQAMNEDTKVLGLLKPYAEPRATEHIEHIIDMIQRLIGNGMAYVATNHDVFYAVNLFRHYGELSGKRIEDLHAGERVEIDTAKRDPLDFVLWKSAKPGEPYWNSPWGPGRPGWHIECSAMSIHCLGDHFDIHGGGMDLMFPHHENEIAQSEAATGHKFVNMWMHNGFVRVNEEKMSKSVGNFFTVREILTKLDNQDKERAGEIIRFFILQSHYRSPLNYAFDELKGAEKRLSGMYRALHRAGDYKNAQAEKDNVYSKAFTAAMDDDFNTSDAMAELDKLSTEINSELDNGNTQKAQALAATLQQLADQVGILLLDPARFLKISSAVAGDDAINQLAKKRDEARKNKNWAEADRLRKEIQAQGYIVEDGPKGTIWRKE